MTAINSRYKLTSLSAILVLLVSGSLSAESASAVPATCTAITSIALAGGEGGHVNANIALTATFVGSTPESCTPDTPTFIWEYSDFQAMTDPIEVGTDNISFTPTDGADGSLNLVGKYIQLTFSYKPNANTTTTLTSIATIVWPANVVVPFMDAVNPVTFTYVGSTLTAVGFGVGGTPAPVETYRWWSCTDNSTALFSALRITRSTVSVGAHTCKVVVGATSSSYTVTGRTTGDATGRETGPYFFPEVKESNAYGTVAAFGISLPEVTSPSFAGNAWEGSTLNQSTSSTASGYPAPTILYSWQTTSDDGVTWSTVDSTTASYRVKAVDRSLSVQKKIRLVATATIGSRSATASSPAVNTYTAPNATGGSVVAGDGNFTAPVSFRVGQTVWGHPWQVMGTPWPELAYQWYICDSLSDSALLTGTCVTTGAPGTSNESTKHDFSFVVPEVAAGKYLTFSASLTNAATTFNLNQSRIMPSRIIYSALALTSDPIISGTKVVGQTLSASAPATSSLPAPKIAYQWLSADDVNGTYESITGATKNTFKILDAQLGKFIKVQATATLPMNDPVTRTSSATEVILSNQTSRVLITNSSAARSGLAGTPITVTVSGGSGGGATTIASVTDGCTVSGLTINRSSSIGTCAVVATVAANNNYLSASSTAATFTFNGVPQSPALLISNTTTTNITKGPIGVTLSTTGGASDGVVTYALPPTSVCSLVSGVLTVSTATNPTSAVSCPVTATKAASGIYKEARVTKTFTFKK